MVFRPYLTWQNLKYGYLRKRASVEHKPVVLITGCGSGVGFALAKLFYASEHYRVIITARQSKIEFLKAKFPESDRFWVRELDVTNAEQRRLVVAEIEKAFGGVNILINNAGVSYRAVMEHMTDQDDQKQMDVNYFGALGLIRLVIPSMRRLGRGKIICISSVSGMLAMPTMAAYSASKHALEGACEALWYEMRPLGIAVSLIQPGFIHSKSFENVAYTEKSFSSSHGEAAEYSDYYQSMTPFIERLMRLSRTSPGDVANLIMRVVRTQNPPLWIPATADAFLFYYLRRLFPRGLFIKLLFWLLPNSSRWGEGYSKRRR